MRHAIAAAMRRLERGATRADGRPDRRVLLGVLLAAYALFCATYLPINFYSIGRDAHTLFLPGEERIPFVPEFEFIYLWGYVLPVLAIWKLPDARRLVQLLGAFGLTLLVAYTTYLTFPVYLERPVLVVDSPATFLLSIEYLDPSYNHFPSLHVALGWLVYLSCRETVRHRSAFVAGVLALSISTVFVKQHYVVDVVYGAALAAVSWWVAVRVTTRSECCARPATEATEATEATGAAGAAA